MLTIVGDDELDIIQFQNGMTIKMDFATDKTGNWGWRGRISGKWRRVRLYNARKNLIDEVIEENPLFEPNIKMTIPNDDEIIF